MLYTFGWTLFLLPYQIVTGGVTGVAAVIYYGTGIPIYFSYFIINAILLVAALKILGLKFMVKTIYAIGMLSVLLALVEDVVAFRHLNRTKISRALWYTWFLSHLLMFNMNVRNPPSIPLRT